MKRTLSSYLRVLLVLLFCFVAFGAMAQNRSVTGTIVSSEDGLPLPGVSIREKGTTNGTTTGANGEYRLTVASAESVIVYTFVGFVTQEVTVGNQSTINLTLMTDVSELGEVVVIGYGTQEQKDLTSSIATVNADELTKTPAAQPMQALQGKVPGVQIVSAGAPGASPTVRVRGVGSLESNSAPLYVVDGMFFDNIDFLNSSDIETVSVLKDASASAIYGVRASNGVILITTKSGDYNQAPQIVYDGYYGTQVAQNVMKMANTEQFVNYALATGSAADASFIDNAFQRYGRSHINPNVPDVNTDWYNEVLQTAPIQNHSISVNGGNDATRYAVGLNYFDQQGLLKGTRNDYERINLRTKLDFDVSEKLTMGVNLNLSNSNQYVAENSVWFKSYFAVPIIPVYDDQNTAATPNQYSNAQQLGYRGSQNPFYDLEYNDNRNQATKILANVYLEYDLIPQMLSFKTAYNYSYSNVVSRNVDFAYHDGVTNVLSALRRSSGNNNNQIWDNYLTFNKDFDLHHLTAVAGYSFRSETSEGVFVRGTELEPDPTKGQDELWYLNGSQIDIGGSGDYGSAFYGSSYFGRLAYNYDDRYLLYGTFRRDGTNRFQQKWGNFFTVGAGWVLSEEEFFNVSNVDLLKFRGGWGQLGNSGVSAAVGAPTIDPRFVAIDDTRTPGNVLIPTFDIVDRWETTEELNIGLSSLMFNERLSIEADYFVRDTKNAAVTIILPLIRSNVRRSAGEIRNSGFEFAANWSDFINNELSYRIGGNFATLNNEVLSLGGPQYLNAGSAEFRQRSIIGSPIQAFYGYETDGIFQSQDDIDNSGYTNEFINNSGIEPGDFRYKDQNGDGVIDDNDRVVLGSYLPDLTYGFNIGLSWKNFDFSADFQGQVGHSILNRKRGEIIFTQDTNIDADLATNLWTGEGTSNKYPSATGLRKGWNQSMSDYFVEDGSYFRIQNVRLSYTLNEGQLFTDMPETRFTFTAERPLTVFDYNGFNPEVANGIDRQTYPIPAIYTLGINLKF
ncbi:SusC/RagA family TonB-linked outer membrane protein [Roseivirga pacifica]|uniref:SusC/RagA family TonB-linked outer membrane protein n=1 Tax=Roseivirga pacifica TaxID=1267423 RepID=UPI003BAE2896